MQKTTQFYLPGLRALPHLIISTLSLLLTGATLLNDSILGQTVSSPAAVPETVPVRPILKVRQPAPNSSSSSGRVHQVPAKAESAVSDVSSNAPNEPNVRFEGLNAFTVAQVLKLFRERGVWVQKDQRSSSQVLVQASSVLKETLAARGYMQATVEALQDQSTGGIVFWVFEGPRSSIGEIRFEGNRIFSSEELATRMRELLQRYEESAKGYDAEVFDYCLRQLSNFMRSRGYVQAILGEPTKELKAGGLVVTIPVREGVRYRLGNIKIDGAEKFTQEQVRAMLSLQPGDIVSGEAIGKWLDEDLKELYGEIGFVQYTAEPDPEFKVVDHAANEGIVDFKVTIEEGQQFRIRSIRFDGSNISENELHTLLLIRPGNVYNQQLFEKSVNQLNESKRFEMIDKHKDVEFKTDEEEGLLEITLRVKRVEPQ